MGEYNRLNKLLEQRKEALAQAEYENADPETIADLEISIGEIKGALLEMAEVDGLDDPYEAFDYYEDEPDEECQSCPYYYADDDEPVACHYKGEGDSPCSCR